MEGLRSCPSICALEMWMNRTPSSRLDSPQTCLRQPDARLGHEVEPRPSLRHPLAGFEGREGDVDEVAGGAVVDEVVTHHDAARHRARVVARLADAVAGEFRRRARDCRTRNN